MTRLSLILLLLLSLVAPCLGKPGERLKRGKAQDLNLGAILLEGNLRLSRLFLAFAAADLPLTIQELDNTTQRYLLLKQQLQASSPVWNTPQWNKGFSDIEKVLDFTRFQMEVRLGSVGDLETRVEEFVEIPELQAEQKIALLISAARAGYQRGQLTQSQKFVHRAEELANGADLSPVALFSLRTTSFQTRGFEVPDKRELLEGFRHAWEPLATYRSRIEPIHDTDWLLAREATRYWIEELSRLGPDGVPSLLVIYQKSRELWNDRSKAWDENKFKKIGFPFSSYLKSIAELSVMAAAIDQLVSTSEALPAEELVKNNYRTTLDEIEEYLKLIPVVARAHCNAELDPTLATFELGQGGLLQEIKGRSSYLKARFVEDSAKPALLKEAVNSILQSDNKPVQVAYLFKVADIVARLGKLEQAEQAWTKALETATEADLTIDILQAREKLARHALEQENWAVAKQQAQAGLETLKEALPFVGRDSRAANELTKRSHALSSIVAKASLATHDTNAALAALDLGGDVGAAASKMSAETKPAFASVDTTKKKVVQLTEKVETLKEMPPSETRDALLAENEKLLADTKSDFLTQSRKIREENSALYSSVLRFDPLDLPDVQGVIPEDAAVVQYFPTDTELYIFVVSKESFALRSVKVAKSKIDERVVSLLTSVTRPGIENEKMNLARQELYNTLIAPLEKDIAGKTTLVLIPSGRLNFLPFGILSNAQGDTLLEQKLLLELAKPTDFLRIASSNAPTVTSVVVYANATLDLPSAAIEGQTIASLFQGSKLFEGKEASKANFLSHGATKDILHLATHGQLDMSDALKSHLDLAEGQQISQQEIFEMDLERTTLVTLSACNTALSERHDVDFVTSLAEAFWIAGSRSVVATLWSVDDDSTGLLMGEFYKGIKSGKTKSQALRDAQLAVKNDSRFEHPYYWGGIVLFGDWR